jgi:hypothetical protein
MGSWNPEYNPDLKNQPGFDAPRQTPSFDQAPPIGWNPELVPALKQRPGFDHPALHGPGFEVEARR